MLSKQSVDSECYIPWESAPAYSALLRVHSEEHINRMLKVKFLEIEEQEAEK